MIINHHPIPTNGHTAWGLDRIAFTYPVDPSQCDLSSNLWSSSSTQILSGTDGDNASLTGTITLGQAATARVSLYVRNSRCRIEFNPSRVMSPKGTQLLPPELTAAVVSQAIDEVRQAAWPAFDTVTQDGEIVRDLAWQEQVLINRLDLARNFRISIPEAVKAALEAKDARYQKSKHRYTQSDGAWGIENRTKSSGKDIMYDKTAEQGTTDIDPEFDERAVMDGNVLRFETQMKKPRTHNMGLQRLHLITPQSCWDALARRWEATGWGSPIATGGDVYTLVQALPYAQRADLVGYLMLKAHGAETGISINQERRMRKLAKHMGLTPGVPLATQGRPDSFLNLGTGQLEAWTSEGVVVLESGSDEEVLAESEAG